MESFSTTFFCPMYSSSVGGRRVRLNCSSSVEISSGETSRCLGMPDSVKCLRSPALYQHLRRGERQRRRQVRLNVGEALPQVWGGMNAALLHHVSAHVQFPFGGISPGS